MVGRTDARIGYVFAIVAAAVSGFAIFVNSYGVKLFSDSTLYTTLKNSVVGVILVLPLLLISAERAQFARLSRRQWAWLLALALIGGSIPYLLFFRGLQLTTAVTGSLANHLQFVVVAVLAVLFLRERLHPAMWIAIVALAVGTNLGTNLDAVRWNQGAFLLLASTVLFAAGFVITKHLLRELSTLSVMGAKMTLGSLVLIAYAAVTGSLSAVAHLSYAQWQFVVLTGLILLVFTATTFIAIKHAPVTTVMAIGTAAPIVTIALQVGANQRVKLTEALVAGLAIILVSVVVIAATGIWGAQRKPRSASA